MKGNKKGPFQESFYHQPPPVRMSPRGSSNRGRGGMTAKKSGRR